jgi:hypothetical protein
MRKNRTLLKIGMLIVLAGLFLKIILIPGGGLLLCVGFISLVFLSLSLAVSCINNIKNNIRLKIWSVLMLAIIAICSIAILFRYQWWNGWHLFTFIGIPFFLVLSILFLIIRCKFVYDRNAKYFLQNIFLLWTFTLVLGIIPLFISSRTFYNMFNYRRVSMSYEKFIEQVSQRP